MLDVLVIGAGLGGLTAALAAAEAGMRVRVVTKGMGAVHWHAGAIDLLGYLPGSDFAVEKPLEAFEALDPAHPYRILGPERTVGALHRLRGWAGPALGYDGSLDPVANRLLPSPAGAVRPTLLAPAAQQAGDLADSAPMLLVGIEGLRDFFPRLIAENLGKQGITARAVFIPWEAITTKRDRNAVQLATEMDDPAVVRRVAAAIRPMVQPGERVGVPALVGLEKHPESFALLGELLGAPLFEIPMLPPSVPGIRLYRALRERLTQLGVRIEANMSVAGFHAADGRIEWVETETSSRPLRHTARAYVLATGGLLGGGFNSDTTGRVWELCFDLPLTVPQNRAEWFRPAFFDPQGQPVFTGGVAVNDDLQPVDAAGSVLYSNLWAAGGTLAHCDPILERSLEGIAVATGVAAGEKAAASRTGRAEPSSALPVS